MVSFGQQRSLSVKSQLPPEFLFHQLTQSLTQLLYPSGGQNPSHLVGNRKGSGVYTGLAEFQFKMKRTSPES